jgi:uncharacterized damage-inducible protein DinB
MQEILGDERYAHYTTDLLLRAYRYGHKNIVQAVQGLSIEELKERPIPGKWSIFEIVMHLADAEIIGACRFRQVLSLHSGLLPVYDEAAWAVHLDYQSKSRDYFDSNLNLFNDLRKTTTTLLLACTDEDWAKTGDHPARGTMTLRGLLELYADHSERHLVQILERRRLLKKQIDIEIFLKDRLY